MKEKIKVIYKEVGKDPKVIEIQNTLEAKQKLVGGLIEAVEYKDVVLICNEEGKIYDLKPNVQFAKDYIAGNFLVAGDDFETGDFISLTNDQIKDIKEDLISKSIKYENDYEMEVE